MTAGTVTRDTLVRERGWCKSSPTGMTDIAVLCGGDMRWTGLRTLADCIASIMTGIASIGGYGRTAMVYKDIGESRGVVTAATVFAGILVDR